MRRISVHGVDSDETDVIAQPEDVYVATPGGNREWDTSVLRCEYSWLVTPRSSIDWDMESQARTVVKQEPVLGGYDPSAYVTERLWATAPDGVQVPISAVRRRDTPLDGTAPALLYGYGSYEMSMERRSHRRGCRCSTAASSTPSPTCAAAARWGGAGTRPASCR